MLKPDLRARPGYGNGELPDASCLRAVNLLCRQFLTWFQSWDRSRDCHADEKLDTPLPFAEPGFVVGLSGRPDDRAATRPSQPSKSAEVRRIASSWLGVRRLTNQAR